MSATVCASISAIRSNVGSNSSRQTARVQVAHDRVVDVRRAGLCTKCLEPFTRGVVLLGFEELDGVGEPRDRVRHDEAPLAVLVAFGRDEEIVLRDEHGIASDLERCEHRGPGRGNPAVGEHLVDDVGSQWMSASSGAGGR